MICNCAKYVFLSKSMATPTDLSALGDLNQVTANISEMNPSRMEQYMNQFLDWLADKAFALLVTLIFLFIGFKVSKFIVKLIGKSFDKSGLESSVSGFLLSLIKGVLYAVVFIMAASILGFQVTSLVTILGTASLAIGLALQGSLANFAGGVLILLMKPFKVGDYIIENDKQCEGTVIAIDIFYTKLRTVDNKIIVIPNGNITSNSIVNVTYEGDRRLDISVGVAYDSDLKLVKETLEKIALDSGYCDVSRGLDVFVEEFDASAIRMGLRFYVKTEMYWKAKWAILEAIKNAFDEKNIEIPYQQIVVHDKK